MRLIRIGALSAPQVRIVLLEVPLEPHRLRIPFEGQNVRRNSIEKPPVMRNDDRTPREINKRFLEPAQRIDVKIIRRLVEQQNIPARLQQLRQVKSVSLSTR